MKTNNSPSPSLGLLDEDMLICAEDLRRLQAPGFDVDQALRLLNTKLRAAAKQQANVFTLHVGTADLPGIKDYIDSQGDKRPSTPRDESFCELFEKLKEAGYKLETFKSSGGHAGSSPAYVKVSW